MTTMFIVLGLAFLLNLYVIWLTINEFDKRFMRATSRFIEEDKYFDLMVNELGMKRYEAEEEYSKIESYSHLIRINKEMEKFLKKEKVYA